MFRFLRNSCVLTFSVLVLTAGTAAAQQPTEQDHEAHVVARATDLYGQLVGKNIRHHRVREDIEPYFESHQTRSNFLIRLSREMRDAGLADSRPKEVSIRLVEVDPFYGTAQTEAELEGAWFLWFNRSFQRVDTWTLVNGEWYVDAPPLRNLEFR